LFDVAEERGSAGSVGLVFQTVVPILFFGSSTSELEIKGGTHVPFSPPYHYITSVFLPTLGKMGLRTRCEIETWGFYPRGGGKIKVSIEPARSILPVVLSERGRLNRIAGISAVANLPLSIAERQKDRALKKLRERGLDGDIEIVRAESIGPGSFLFLMAEFENARGGFSALGARGKSSEQVADEAVGLEFELPAQPARGRDAADGQLDQRAGKQGSAVGNIMAVLAFDRQCFYSSHNYFRIVLYSSQF